MAKKITPREIEARLDVIDKMNTAVAKLTQAQVRLTLAKDPRAKDIDRLRKALIKEVEKLQGKVAVEWSVGAAALAKKLGEANTKVQDRIRNIKNKVSIANNAIKLVGQVDGALKFVKTIVK